MGALKVKYSFSNGSFWKYPFSPKTAIMGAEPLWAGAREYPGWVGTRYGNPYQV